MIGRWFFARHYGRFDLFALTGCVVALNHGAEPLGVVLIMAMLALISQAAKDMVAA